MRRRTILLLGILVAGGAAGAYALLHKADVKDPFALDLPPVAPSGDPVHVRRLVADGDIFRTTGTFSYAQHATGNRGKESTIPAKDIRGTVDAIRRVVPDAGGLLQSIVELWMDLQDAEGSAEPRPRKEHFQFRFRESAEGGAATEHGERRLEGVGQDLASYLETLVGVFTERPPIPQRDVKVGESFDPEQVVDLLPMRGHLWIHFRFRDKALPPAAAPVLGRVWVDGREMLGGEDVLRVRSSLRHAFAGETGEKGKNAPRADFKAAVEGTRRIAIGDGISRTYDVLSRMRVAVKTRDLDYFVETEEHTAVTTKRDRR